VVIDAVFGTGFHGEPREEAARSIDAIRSANVPVVAVDVPSGVNASTGEVSVVCVEAATTVTFHGEKVGLGRSYVKVDGKHVHLHLPAAQVFSTRLDSGKTRVYSRQTGVLVPTDPNLETQVRQEAERQMQGAALADGILRTAQQNAASTIRSLLQGLGFERIDFD